MQMYSEGERSINPSEYVGLLKRHWWLLLLLPLLAALAVYGYILLKGPTYSATATLLVTPASAASGDFSNDANAANLLTRTYGELAKSPVILRRTLTDLRLTRTPTQLAASVTVLPQPATQIISISTKDRDPQLAADIANTIGDQLVVLLTGIQQTESSQSSQALQSSVDKARMDRDNVSAQLAALRGAPGMRTPDETIQIANLASLSDQYQSTYSSLLELQQRLILTQAAAQNRVAVVVRAEPSLRPVDNRLPLYLALALLGGLGLAATGSVILDRSNARVRSSADLRPLTDLPVLATIPRARSKRGSKQIAPPRSPMYEAIHLLRARIEFATNDRKGATIVLTSPQVMEGTSVVAANLAAAFAEAGTQVILIDAHLRGPRQHALFNKQESEPGLSDLLTTLATDDRAIPVGRPDASGSSRVVHISAPLSLSDMLVCSPYPTLRLMLAGTSMHGPMELLTSARVAQALALVREEAEVIIIDAPPLLGVSDALFLAAEADHGVIVIEVGRTRPRVLESALTEIQATGVDVLGFVLLNDAWRRTARR